MFLHLLIGKFGASLSNGIWSLNGFGDKFSKESGVSSRPVFELLEGPDKSKLGSPDGFTSKSPINGLPPLTNKSYVRYVYC